MIVAEENKTPTQAQAPAQSKSEQAALPEKKEGEGSPPQPTGIDGMNEEQLRALYSKTPELFEKIGLKKAEEKKVEEKKPEGKEAEPAKPQSAAPVVAYGGKSLKLPEDLQVDRDVLKGYLQHWNENGFSHEQVQRELDHYFGMYREQAARAAKAQPKPEEIDAKNVAALKADKDFGKDFDKNMEIARQAAAKFGEPELLERLKTSDPVLVRHFWKIGMKDAEDTTPTGGKGRNGEEDGEAEKTHQDSLASRYPNTKFTQPRG